MSTSMTRRLAAAGALAVLVVAVPQAVPASAHAAAPLTCRASAAVKNPEQYSDVPIRVKTAPKAKVRTVARYKTTNTIKRTRANEKGRARVVYDISGASPGYKVRVDVTVAKKGRTSTCSTAFTPRRG